MATASAKTRIEVREVEVPDGINLYLSQEEAQFVADLLSMVGGNPDTTRRGRADDIAKALRQAGVTYAFPKPDMQGGISMEEAA